MGKYGVVFLDPRDACPCCLGILTRLDQDEIMQSLTNALNRDMDGFNENLMGLLFNNKWEQFEGDVKDFG
ncbi:MAG: hypothetical protein EZS28_011276 [Streblomastix strix]|uniref:Uncharacterized protein n=1 Tax=Streblomastix strix TaxID=222440 RepID=A0A5J4WE62_9EUKA|nr:MAG: hypothetical protein EZS28_011276 [Streblomastix strix]